MKREYAGNMGLVEELLTETLTIPIHPVDEGALDKPDESSSLKEGITVINDTRLTAALLVNNTLWGTASEGFVGPGQSIEMPAGWSWWDVYVLFETEDPEVFIRWFGPISCSVKYHLKKSNVGYRDTIKISEM
ncbi:MAG: hypothetical protein QNK37_18530 [Acidobacteriota bacterium]|nr:hypothetical protein [Acidobacteriota bacterium]